MIIAIDGPAGSGKSTIASLLAKRLGFCKLDTGAMYRSVAWAALNRGVDVNDDQALGKLALSLDIRFSKKTDAPSKVFVDDVDVTQEIRTQKIDRMVSKVAACPSVRSAMVDLQRRISQDCDIVAEGRDIGTVVFPHADIKIFMTADPRQRAVRRVLQRHKGIQPESQVFEREVEATLDDIKARDIADSSRKTAPLAAAKDAIHVDSSHMTIEDVLTFIVGLVQEN